MLLQRGGALFRAVGAVTGAVTGTGASASAGVGAGGRGSRYAPAVAGAWLGPLSPGELQDTPTTRRGGLFASTVRVQGFAAKKKKSGDDDVKDASSGT